MQPAGNTRFKKLLKAEMKVLNAMLLGYTVTGDLMVRGGTQPIFIYAGTINGEICNVDRRGTGTARAVSLVN